ncbi:hypothetical protein [Pseudomonas sp. Larv2_ips]|uniref:hypothetical protein n=1 Tax=Pseudomonas sp. Larv2_ips TaxID=1896942 RepID=UPI0013004964|nr:hypothetical protein [Pseudomonas sp. Larv2_ips]
MNIDKERHLLDTIHIIDEYLAKPKTGSNASSTQNFTMPGRDTPQISSELLKGVAASSLALSLVPTPLIFAAVSAIPSLISLVSGDKDEDKAVRADKERLLAVFVERATYSPSQAREAGYRFQPGHPMSGKSYRRHPLADISEEGNKQLYIPSETYDAHVLEERESELIRLLVSLGATRISITKNTTSTKSSLIKAGGSIDAGAIATAGAGLGRDSQHASGTSDTRVFTLTGNAWDASREIDVNKFFWLAFEPSWKAVLFARQYGGCTEASLELKENTSFSEDTNIELSIKVKQIGGGASANFGASDNGQRAHLINVQFAAAEPKI